MKVLIIGGNGFIGSHVQDALLVAGHGVRVLDRAPEKYRDPSPEVDYRLGDSSDRSAVLGALTGVETVIYLASTTVPSTSNADIPRDIQSNLLPLINTLEAMATSGVSRVIFLSSGGTVYGLPQKCPVTESEPTDPICSYGVVKLASEKYLRMYQHLHGLLPAILRPANVYGPREGHEGVQGFVGTCLLRVLNDEPMEVWGDGSVVRDYVYVEDLAQAVLLLLENSHTGLFNIGSEEGRSLLEVLNTVGEVTGERPDVRFLGARAYDVPRLVLDSSRAHDVLSWRATVPFSDGVARHWQWLCR